MLRLWPLVLVVTGTSSGAQSAPAAAITYTLTDLGTLGGESGATIARDINDCGQVTGQSQNASGQNRGFLWEDGQGMTPLGTLGGPTSPARGINEPDHCDDTGQIVGFSRIPNMPNEPLNRVRAYLWKKDPPTNLDTLAGFSNSEAWSINDFGVAVGRSFNNPTVPGGATTEGRAVQWKDGQIEDLGPDLDKIYGKPGERVPYSEAWSINNLGQVVGEAGDADQQAKAFLYEKGADGTNKVTDIDAAGRQDPDHPVFPYQYSEAAAINDHGQVVGWSYRTTINDPPSTPSGPEGKAFLYEKGEDGTATVAPLESLDGDLYSRARDIDETGRAVSIVYLGDISGTGTAIGLVAGHTVDRVDKVVAVSAPQDVATGFPEHRVITIFAIEDIVALAALQPVIARAAVNPVVVGLTVQAVPSISANHVVLAGTAFRDASSSTGVKVVVVLASREGVGSFLTVEPVLATKPDHIIYAGTTRRMIRIRSAGDTVAALTTQQDIPAGHALHAIVSAKGFQPIVAGEAAHRIHTLRAG